MPEEVADGVFCIKVPLPQNPLKYTNAYLIKNEDKKGKDLLIDTGFNREECEEPLRNGLEYLDVNLNNLDIFLTHIHADHMGLASALAAQETTVRMGEEDLSYFRMDDFFDSMADFAVTHGFPKNLAEVIREKHPGKRWGTSRRLAIVPIRHGERLHVGSRTLTCIKTRGHTWGHICLFDGKEKMLFSGDHILGDITPNISVFFEGENLLEDYLFNLKAVERMEIETVLPGHRRIVKEPEKRIEELINHHRQRLHEVEEIVKDEGPIDAYSAASQMKWDLSFKKWDEFPLLQKWFATGEAIAHLVFLAEKGDINKTAGPNGKTLWY